MVKAWGIKIPTCELKHVKPAPRKKNTNQVMIKESDTVIKTTGKVQSSFRTVWGRCARLMHGRTRPFSSLLLNINMSLCCLCFVCCQWFALRQPHWAPEYSCNSPQSVRKCHNRNLLLFKRCSTCSWLELCEPRVSAGGLRLMGNDS